MNNSLLSLLLFITDATKVKKKHSGSVDNLY